MNDAFPKYLSLWVVCQNPSDAPGLFTVRRHIAHGPQAGPTNDVLVSPDLETIREEMRRRGLVRMERYPEDLPVIVETWI
jgi:hypothetical protein